MKLLYPLLFLAFATKISYSKEVALTIDDSPRGDERIYSGWERTRRFVDVLKREKIQAVFFSNSDRLDQASGRERLQAYADAGHIIANHTHSHPSLHRAPVEAYLANIDEADRLLRGFSTFKRWFRFPFLKEGATLEVRDRVRKHLKTSGYINGYTTVDNFDYVLNELVQKGLGQRKKVDLSKACRMLSDLSLEGLEFQEALARKYLKAQVRQVLLMHENDLEAYCLPQLIRDLREKGWSVISPERAFEDELLSKQPETLYLDQGRIAALIHARDWVAHRFHWEDVGALQAEFSRRKIVQEKK